MRHKNEDWDLQDGTKDNDGVNRVPNGTVQVAVLMDIRDQLANLNRLLRCPAFLSIPRVLKQIQSHTRPRKRKPRIALIKRNAA